VQHDRHEHGGIDERFIEQRCGNIGRQLAKRCRGRVGGRSRTRECSSDSLPVDGANQF